MQRKELKRKLSKLTSDELIILGHEWELWARPRQLPPKNWILTWLILAGRGYGKTRTGAETLRRYVESGEITQPTIIAPTAGDARDIMIEGESGLLHIFPPDQTPYYEPSKRRITFKNGIVCKIRSAEEPERLRGLQHDFVWCDEIASWRYLQESWDMMMLGLRLGKHPRVVATTTPKPLPLIKKMVKDKKTIVTSGNTYENKENLAGSFIEMIEDMYEGTRLGRQELYAEILEDVEGALWNYSMIEQHRVTMAPELIRIVVAIDPAMTSGPNADETGIIVMGVDRSNPQHGYVLADYSGRYPPEEWARKAIDAFDMFQADRIVAEVNQGGDIVENLLRTQNYRIPYTAVRATRGKRTRAEPVSALYEQGKIHHVGNLSKLEEQMTEFTPDMKDSPDRVDALVWAAYYLMLQGKSNPRIRQL